MRARIADDAKRVVPSVIVREDRGGVFDVDDTEQRRPATHRVVAAVEVGTSAGRVGLVRDEYDVAREGLVGVVVDAVRRG